VPSNFTDYDIQYWPGNPNQLTEFGVDGFPIFKVSQNPEAAWTLIKYLISTEVQDALVGSVESPLSNIPVRRSSAELMEGLPPANSRIFFESLDNALFVPVPSTFNQMEDIVVRYTSSIFADEMSVEDATRAAQEELSSIISCD
jgi:ABC-type glycerol-3-phosphate transport system substrate-binding protein